MKDVYVDNHSGTRIDNQVYNEMLPYLKEHYGNPQNLHTPGIKAREALDAARHQVAELIGVKDEEIYFTSNGSEANNLAIKGMAEAYKSKGNHIIISAIEHFSVLNAAKRLEQSGYEVTALPVDKYGVVAPDDLIKALKKETILVSIQHANPEIGTMQPIKELAAIARQKGVVFHTDAVCTTGTIPVNAVDLGVDALSLAGSQFHGPKGAAAVYVKKGIRIIPQIDGGVQENGRRAGTENIAAIVGFGKACDIAKATMVETNKKLVALRDRLIAELPQKIEYIYLNGHPTQRLPHNVNFSVEFIEGEGMLLFLDEKGIYVSSGSACASKALKLSHVLAAIKIDVAVAQGSVLMTLSKYNTDEDVNYILAEFPPIVKKLREMSPLFAYYQKTGKRQAAGPGTDYEHHHDHETCDS